MKKMLVLLALLLIVIAMGACRGGGGGTATTPAPAPATPGAGTTQPTTPDATTEEEPWFTGYPMDAEHITLTFWLTGGPQLHPAIGTWQESPFHSSLGPAAGVTIEWMFPPPGAEGPQEFALILASGDLPDIMFAGPAQIMNQAQLLMDDGVIRDLTPHIAEWAPNYHAFIHENPARVAAFRTDDGRYYGFGFFREDGGWNDSFQGPVIRQDWLDEQGLALPETISDWDHVLRVFNEEYGAVFSAPWGRFDESGNIGGAFGAFAGTRYRLFVDTNNRVQLGNVLPEWADYLAQMAIWWNDGLIDQDLFNDADPVVRAKALDGVTGFAYTSMGQLSGWVLDAEREGTGADWIGLQYPRGDDGTLSMVFGGPGIGNTATVITRSVGDDRMEVAMRFLDFAYSPEGFVKWNFGVEGVSWNWEGDRRVFSEYLHNHPDGLHGAMEQHVGSVWNGPTIQATEVLIQRNHPIAIAANDTWFWPNQAIAERHAMPRGLALNTQEGLRNAELYASIRTYVDEMAARFFTGAEPIENFDNFVATVEGMGLQELLDIWQGALDRFLAR